MPAEPQSDFASWNEHGVGIFRAVFAAGQFDDGGEHIKKWNEVKNNGGVDQHLIRGLMVSLWIWLSSRIAPEIPACTRIEM